MTSGLSPEDFDDLHDFIRLQITAGFAPIDDIVDEAVESTVNARLNTDETPHTAVLSGTSTPSLSPARHPGDNLALAGPISYDIQAVRVAARAIADRALAAHRAGQAGWPAPTDCDRLDAAFAGVRAAGIVARQHFSCCGTCGAQEIHDEIDQADQERPVGRGFTFFHVRTPRRHRRRAALPELRCAPRTRPTSVAIGTRGGRDAASPWPDAVVERQARTPHRATSYLAAPPPLKAYRRNPEISVGRSTRLGDLDPPLQASRRPHRSRAPRRPAATPPISAVREVPGVRR